MPDMCQRCGEQDFWEIALPHVIDADPRSPFHVFAYYKCTHGHKWTCHWSKRVNELPADSSSGKIPEHEREVRTIPQAVKIAVAVRDGGRCCWCGSEENIEYDHIFPVSRGGKTEEENLQLLCKKCNSRKGDSVI